MTDHGLVAMTHAKIAECVCVYVECTEDDHASREQNSNEESLRDDWFVLLPWRLPHD
jgi:hypothetical protein